MTQTTGKKRDLLDKFYTKPSVAQECIDTLMKSVPDVIDYLWVEPSAGSGSFLHSAPSECEVVGVDISPASDDIEKADYLKWEPPSTKRKIVVFGNPPFGRQASIAKAFIARSCKFATVIAFILPRSFTKPSMYDAFSSKFHLITSVELEEDSFVVNDKPYNVPCVFQVWRKEKTDRKKTTAVKESGYKYVKAGEDYDIAVRRVGVFAGRCYLSDDVERSPQSHHNSRDVPTGFLYNSRSRSHRLLLVRPGS